MWLKWRADLQISFAIHEAMPVNWLKQLLLLAVYTETWKKNTILYHSGTVNYAQYTQETDTDMCCFPPVV